MGCPSRRDKALRIPTRHSHSGIERCQSVNFSTPCRPHPRQFQHIPGDIKNDPMPPAREPVGASGSKIVIAKLLVPLGAPDQRNSGETFAAAASRAIEQIFLRHASAFVPRSAYKTEPSDLQRAAAAAKVTQEPRAKNSAFTASIFCLRSHFVDIDVGDKLQKRPIRVPKVD